MRDGRGRCAEERESCKNRKMVNFPLGRKGLLRTEDWDIDNFAVEGVRAIADTPPAGTAVLGSAPGGPSSKSIPIFRDVLPKPKTNLTFLYSVPKPMTA